jgi:nucleoside-diphosphate-sugar epimerase
MKVLVAGGAGFIGNRVCEELLAQGHQVVCVDNLLTGTLDNTERFSRLPGFEFRRQSAEDVEVAPVDLIIHLASPASPIDFDRIPVEIIRANVLGTWRLLELAHQSRAMFLFASSSEVYGEAAVHPQPEHYFGNVDPTGPRACYDESKRLGETLVATFVRKYDVCARIIRIFNTYGPRMRPDDGRVVPEFITAALEGRPLVLHGGGLQTRSFCFVDDLVRGIIQVASDPDNAGEVFNLGNPTEVTIRRLAEIVIQTTGSTSALVDEERRPQDPSRRKPDVTKVTTRYGWQPAIGLQEGIARTVTWFSDPSVTARANSVLPA